MFFKGSIEKGKGQSPKGVVRGNLTKRLCSRGVVGITIKEGLIRVKSVRCFNGGFQVKY